MATFPLEAHHQVIYPLTSSGPVLSNHRRHNRALTPSTLQAGPILTPVLRRCIFNRNLHNHVKLHLPPQLNSREQAVNGKCQFLIDELF